MKIAIVAVGRLKAGPERTLFDRYAERVAAAGRPLGLGFESREIAESAARSAPTRKSEEAAAVLKAVAAGTVLVALDEGGKSPDSRDFAARIAGWRESGARSVAFVIGGPDGLDPSLIARAELRLAFGAMTWPHQLVRIMLAEQLYRAVTILSGHPYHRD